MQASWSSMHLQIAICALNHPESANRCNMRAKAMAREKKRSLREDRHAFIILTVNGLTAILPGHEHTSTTFEYVLSDHVRTRELRGAHVRYKGDILKHRTLLKSGFERHRVKCTASTLSIKAPCHAPSKTLACSHRENANLETRVTAHPWSPFRGLIFQQALAFASIHAS